MFRLITNFIISSMLLVFSLIVNFETVWGQQQIPDSCLARLYPLHIGDYWEYNTTGIIPTVYKKVIGDTTLSNGHTYFVVIWDDDFSHEYADTLFERVTDDLKVVKYFSNEKGSGEQLIYKLDVQQGESWISSDSLKSSVVTLDTVFAGDFFNKVRYHYEYSFPSFRFHVLAEDLGLIGIRDEFLDGAGLVLRGCIIDRVLYGTSLNVTVEREPSQPYIFTLHQNYPNPFNSITTIKIELKNVSPQRTILTVYNVLGQPIITLLDDLQTRGKYKLYWNGLDDSGKPVPSGIYFYRMVQGNNVATKQMLLLR